MDIGLQENKSNYLGEAIGALKDSQLKKFKIDISNNKLSSNENNLRIIGLGLGKLHQS